MGIFGKAETKPVQQASRPGTPPAAQAPAKAPSRGPAPEPTATECIIGSKTVVKGDITGDETVLVEGTVEGTLSISRDLRVGPGGKVKATVKAHSIVVAGEISGDCQAEQRVHLEATGRLTGNIRAPRVVIVEGATFKGNSDMSPPRDGGGAKKS
jgi:cytoskeletal protein CcmA (bactofilin family)